jgi:hypothetical protein
MADMKKTYFDYHRDYEMTDRPRTTHEIFCLIETDERTYDIYFRWYNLGMDKPCPRLEVFDDAWKVFAVYPELFIAMSSLQDMTCARFCEWLETQGFVRG